MNEQEIIHYALHTLIAEGITPEWNDVPNDGEIDGKLELQFKFHPQVKFNVEVKKEIRAVHIDQINNIAKKNTPFLLIAERIFPKIKQELKEREINYLETNGNMFLLHKGLYINIDGKRYPEKTSNTSGNRAFTKKGLQVIYQFLIEPEWINKTYREIAEKTGTGLGNINNIFNGLKEEGYLLPLTKNEYQLDKKTKLIEKWVVEYERKLKPKLVVGNFRFLNPEDFYNYKNIPLNQEKTLWGGEPAGDLLTNYLRPEELTLYTTEERTEIIKNYRLIPDINGNVKVYKTFWQTTNQYKNTVHPLLAYADLIAKGDRRCTETAQKIYDEYLQNKF